MSRSRERVRRFGAFGTSFTASSRILGELPNKTQHWQSFTTGKDFPELLKSLWLARMAGIKRDVVEIDGKTSGHPAKKHRVENRTEEQEEITKMAQEGVTESIRYLYEKKWSI